MFRYVIVVFFCSPVLAIPAGRTEVTYPSLETLRSGEKILTLRAFGNDIQLKLEPAGHVIADDFTVMDGERKVHKSDVKNLKSKLFRNKEKDAALYINEAGYLEIKGMLTSTLRIEPYESQDTVGDGIKAHRITETLVETKRFFNDAVFSSNLTLFSDYEAREFNEDQCVEIEYLFLTDSTVMDHYENLENLQTHVASMFVELQNMMDSLNLKLKVRLIGVIAYTDEDEPPFVKESLFPGKDIFQFELILDKFSSHFCHPFRWDKLVRRADMIMLSSRRMIGTLSKDGRINANTIGMAHYRGACTSCEKFGVIMDRYSVFYTAQTLAHESAHLLGSPHDGEKPYYRDPGAEKCHGYDGFIMRSIPSFGTNSTKFSTCSLENIKYFLNNSQASCLITECKETL